MTTNTDQHDGKRPFRDGERVRNTDSGRQGILVSSETTIGGERWKVLLDNDSVTVWFAYQMEHVNPAAASPTPPSADALDWLQRQDPDRAGRVRALVESCKAQRMAASWIGGMVNHCRRSGHEIVFVFDEEDYAECSTCLYAIRATAPTSEVFLTLWTEAHKEGDEHDSHAEHFIQMPVAIISETRIPAEPLPYANLTRAQLVTLLQTARETIHGEWCWGNDSGGHAAVCERLSDA